MLATSNSQEKPLILPDSWQCLKSVDIPFGVSVVADSSCEWVFFMNKILLSKL
jgi:hypothetical protein